MPAQKLVDPTAVDVIADDVTMRAKRDRERQADVAEPTTTMFNASLVTTPTKNGTNAAPPTGVQPGWRPRPIPKWRNPARLASPWS